MQEAEFRNRVISTNTPLVCFTTDFHKTFLSDLPLLLFLKAKCASINEVMKTGQRFLEKIIWISEHNFSHQCNNDPIIYYPTRADTQKYEGI